MKLSHIKGNVYNIVELNKFVGGGHRKLCLLTLLVGGLRKLCFLMLY